MPTYVYECSSCSKTFEIEQRITENALSTCLCGSEGTVKRLIQPTAIMFKGSGFYVNDSASTAPSSSVETECTGDKSTCTCSANSSPSEVDV